MNMRFTRPTPLVLIFIVSLGLGTAKGADVPPGLRETVIENFPIGLLCSQESERQNGYSSPPTIEEQFEQGCIHVHLGELCDGCREIAAVVYSEICPTTLGINPGGPVRFFWKAGDNWVVVPGDGVSSAVVSEADIDGVSFTDVDNDGRNEILLSSFSPKTTGHGVESHSVSVWELTGTGFRPMISPELDELEADAGLTFPLGEPTECQQTLVYNFGSSLQSPTSVSMRDLDHDGKLELILGPDTKEDPNPEPEEYPARIDATGWRIYALRDGFYTKVAETPVVDGWALPLDPQVAAAINPAAIPQEELLIAGGRVEGTGDGRPPKGQQSSQETVTLYCIAPDGYDPNSVDWSSLVVVGSDPPIRPLNEGVSHPAPYDVRVTPKGWMPSSHAHQLLYLEMARQTRPHDFSMTDDDPVIMMGPGGRLHFSSPYRVLRFERQAVLGWLAEQWRAGRADHKLKSCFTKDGREACYTPIGLPFTVRLRESLGPYPIVAHGLATLWVRN